MKTPSLFVIGTGRSGTSVTARVLAQHYGVCFGHGPRMGKFDDRSGEPVYEDETMKTATIRLLDNGEMSAWLSAFDRVHSQRCSSEVLGLKLLRLRELSIEQILETGVGWIVRTRRDYGSTLASLIRYNRRGSEEERRVWSEDYLEAAEGELVRFEDEVRAARAGIDWTDVEIPPTGERLTDAQILRQLAKRETL